MTMDRAWLYEIRIEGRLQERWSEWFDGLAIRSDRDDETILTGQLPDQAALYGVLSRIRDLNLILVSVARLSAAGDPQERPASETLAPL
ncbi:MAG TPA: hypothetical protein VF784_15265 [Anaerolineales bacterium]